MKGIKKLFFGLIFMTLIGVGFKVDVNAHDLSVKEPSSWEDDGLIVTATFSKADIEKYADGDESGSWDVTVALFDYEDGAPAGTVSEATVTLIKYGKNSYDVVCDKGYVSGSWKVEIPTEKGDIYEKLIGVEGANSLYAKFCAGSDFITGDKYTKPITVNAYKTSVEAWRNGKNVRSLVEFDPDTGYIYLLKNDTGTITIAYDGLGDGYSVQKTENVLDYDDKDGEAIITLDGKGKAYTGKVTFGVDKEFIDLDIEDGHKVGLNYWSREIEYELFNCSEDDIKVYFDNKLLHEGSSYVMDGDTFRFKVPNGTGVGTKVLKFVREGGAEQQYKIQVVDTNKITFTIDDPMMAEAAILKRMKGIIQVL